MVACIKVQAQKYLCQLNNRHSHMCWALNTVGAAVLSGLPSYLTVVPLPPQDKGTITNPADVVGKVLANQLCKERGCGSLPERLPFDTPLSVCPSRSYALGT